MQKLENILRPHPMNTNYAGISLILPTTVRQADDPRLGTEHLYTAYTVVLTTGTAALTLTLIQVTL